MPKLMTTDEVLTLMRKRQGERTDKDFAAELGISPQYLCEVYAGAKLPGPQILDALKLRREFRYQEATAN